MLFQVLFSLIIPLKRPFFDTKNADHDDVFGDFHIHVRTLEEFYVGIGNGHV